MIILDDKLPEIFKEVVKNAKEMEQTDAYYYLLGVIETFSRGC